MSNGSQLWIAAALVSIGAHMMAAPDGAVGPKAREPASGLGASLVTIACYARTLLLFGFTLSIGFVWYETSYWRAALYVTAALPGVMLGEGLTFLLRRQGPRGLVVLAAACLLVGPAIAGFGTYRLAHELAYLAAAPAR